jgi:beta-N-acetylhexosaminidase
MIEGLQEHVAACAKHFPGHGDTDKDSHYDLPRLPHALDRLRACELVPFKAAVAARVACVMTTHVVFDALDPGVAATMSAPAIRLLRDEVGFGGVCVSDCLEMKAISEHFGCGTAAVRAVSAGVDALLVSHTAEAQHEVIASLAAAVCDGSLPEGRVREARTRLDSLARRHARAV